MTHLNEMGDIQELIVTARESGIMQEYIRRYTVEIGRAVNAARNSEEGANIPLGQLGGIALGAIIKYNMQEGDVEALVVLAVSQTIALANVNPQSTGFGGFCASNTRAFKRAADQGNVDGEFFYGFCRGRGIGTEKNLGEALTYLNRAREHGHPKASEEYGRRLVERNAQVLNILNNIIQGDRRAANHR
jgi:TPR repeat protein